MSFFASVKKASQSFVDAGMKQKVRAEIALIDRDVRSRKMVFGVDVYELMENSEKQKKFWSSSEEGDIRAPFDGCRRDIIVIDKEKEQKQQQVDVLDVRMTNKVPAQSVGDKMRNAGSTVNEAATKTKIQGEIMLLDRKIKERKQKFGIEIYDVMAAKETSKNWKAHDKDIRSCYEFAKRDITVKETKKRGKVDEFEALGGVFQPDSDSAGSGADPSNGALVETGGASAGAPPTTPTMSSI